MVCGIMVNMCKRIFFLLMSLMLVFNWQAVIAAPDGKILYAEHCSVCHGYNGEGGVGVPLSLPAFINSVSNQYLFKTIRYGRPGRVMPAFNDLSDAQVSAITGFVRTWGNGKAVEENNELVTGDAKHGERLYAKNCSRCHGVNGRGGKGTGVTFSRKRNLPIIAPALNNSGFLASATDAMIRNTIKFGREGTPMSSQIAVGLSGDDIDDLVSYIRSFENTNIEENVSADGPAVIVVESPYSLDETIENLKQSIADQNFTLIRIEPLNKGFVKAGDENKKQMIMHFCNFKFMFEALSIDPRVGMFLPCRITVVEDRGKVKVMAINPLRLSKLFNNDELDDACKKMRNIYKDLLEDATL